MAQQWYYSLNDQKFGPISAAQLKQIAASGTLKPTDLVWTEGMMDWKQAAKMKGLCLPTTSSMEMRRPPLPIPKQVQSSIPASSIEPSQVPAPNPFDFKKAVKLIAPGLVILVVLLNGIRLFNVASQRPAANKTGVVASENDAGLKNEMADNGPDSMNGGDTSVNFAALDFDTVALDRGPQGQSIEEDTDRLVAGFVGSSRKVYLGQDGNRYRHGKEELVFVSDELINTRVCGGSTWVYGVRHGRNWAINPANGEPTMDETWIKGKRHGMSTLWIPRQEGSIKTDEIQYDNGVLHGMKTTYYATTGNVMSETPYTNGKQQGSGRYYAEDGTLLRIDEWEQGKHMGSRWVSGPLAK